MQCLPHFVRENRAPARRFRICDPKPTSLCTAQLQPPTCSTWHYPTPTDSPLLESNAPCTPFAKTEPLPLVFGFLTPNPPPLHTTQLQTPACSTWHYTTTTNFLLPEFNAFCILFVKTKPLLVVFRFSIQKPPPLHTTQL